MRAARFRRQLFENHSGGMVRARLSQDAARDGRMSVASAVHTIRQFYQDGAVRSRLSEYCGGTSADPATFSAEYVTGSSEALVLDRLYDEDYYSACRNSFHSLLDQGVDLFRSVWDREATLGILDMEYFNTAYPAEAYHKPGRAFRAIEPVFARVAQLLGRFGIEALSIMTGQGYHFAFRVPIDDPVHRLIADLGCVAPSLRGKYSSPGGCPLPVLRDEGRAFDGMGRLFEYFAHRLLEDLRDGYEGMPVVCTETAVGGWHEAVSLDLSMYGDPLYARDIRCPYSSYRKHRIQRWKYGAAAAERIPPLVTLPRGAGTGVDDLLRVRWDYEACSRHAAGSRCVIPGASSGVARLVDEYRASSLYRFHRDFDATEHERPEDWSATYDRLAPSTLPPCVARMLERPNDLLLKPTNIQTLTRVLTAKGWHPKHVAGLIRSKMERDYGWGTQWYKYDAATRANFYVRLFAGLTETGVDREEDLNCVSHAEKGYCVRPNCGWNLGDYRRAGGVPGRE